MKKILIRDDEHARVEVDLEISTFALTWKGIVPSEHLRRVLIQAYMLVQQHGIRLWISDSRRLGAILRDDESWIMTDFTPRTFQAGLERMAVVVSADFFYRLAADRSGPAAPFKLQFFDDTAEACKWLSDPSVAVA